MNVPGLFPFWGGIVEPWWISFYQGSVAASGFGPLKRRQGSSSPSSQPDFGNGKPFIIGFYRVLNCAMGRSRNREPEAVWFSDK
jgi:hypothetical protein